MGEVLLALTAAVLFGSGSVFARRGLVDGGFTGGMLVSLGSGLLVALVAVPFFYESPVVPGALGLFALAGVAAPGLGRVIGFKGMSALGAARSVPLQSSTYPLVATFAGWLVLDEEIGPLHLAGVASIVAGIAVLGSAAPADGQTRRGTLRMFAIPIVAGLVYASGDVVRASALRLWDQPIVGAAVGLAAAFLGWLFAVMLVPRMRVGLSIGGGAPWFVLSGVCSAAAIATLFLALSIGRLSVVSPIVAMQPLFVVVLASVVLRQAEPVDGRRWIGAALTVAGTVLIVVSGGTR